VGGAQRELREKRPLVLTVAQQPVERGKVNWSGIVTQLNGRPA
jgi:hypothetical protein